MIEFNFSFTHAGHYKIMYIPKSVETMIVNQIYMPPTKTPTPKKV